MSAVPAELRERPQWVVWRYEQRPGEEKPTKMPYDPRTGRPAASDHTGTWAPYEVAVERLKRTGYDGVGYMFTYPHIGVDIDGCCNPKTGEIAPWGAELVAMFPGSYAELSPSGTGVHIITRGKRTPRNGKRAYQGGAVEMYDRARFFTFTGEALNTCETIADGQLPLDRLGTMLWPTPQPVVHREPQDAVCTLEDDRIKELAFNATNGDVTARLYAGDLSLCAGDHSACDLALVSRFAFYTQDRSQLARLHRSSGLYRPKWDRDDYRERTLDKALSTLGETYSPGRRQEQAPAQPDNRDAVIARLLAENAELKEKLRQAEEVALTAVRAEAFAHEWERKYAACAERSLHMDSLLRSSLMDPADKQVAYATLRHLEARRDSPKHTDPELGTRVNREAVANLAGVSTDRVTKAWKKFTEAGAWKRTETSRYNEAERHPETTVWLRMDGTLIERTQALAAVELPRKMGGERPRNQKITCTVCGGADLHRHAYSECHDCGHTWGKAERPINPPESETLLAAQGNQVIETLVASPADTPQTVDATPPKQPPIPWTIPPPGPGITDMSTLWDDIPPAEVYTPRRRRPAEAEARP